MNTLLHQRLKRLEDGLSRTVSAPTFPIYDPAYYPQDAVLGQISVGTDNSLNWYDGVIWRTYPGTLTSGIAPQDPVEGQVVVNEDTSLCWYVNGAWYGATGYAVTGSTPQDSIEGQLAIGTNTIAWYIGGQWYVLPELV